MDKKSSLRKQLIAMRKGLLEEQRLRETKDICESLKRIQAIREADVLLLYAAKFPEVALDSIFAWALAQGKKVCFPRVSGDEMDFYFVKDAAELVPGNFGVREPDDTCEPAVFDKAVCLVPGVGFDKTGNRMGYGKGYYDRYLSQTTADIYKIAICYDEQLLEEIPAGDHDVKMDCVVSASHVIEILQKKGQYSIWI